MRGHGQWFDESDHGAGEILAGRYRITDRPYERGAHDRAVGIPDDGRNVFRRGDAETRGQRQIGDLPDPVGATFEIRCITPFAGDASSGKQIEELAGRRRDSRRSLG